MDLLHYEFIDGPDDSINGMLRTLVRKLRYYHSEVSIEEFKAAMPSLQKVEMTLQRLDADMNQPRRNYISEILEELEKESEVEMNLPEELKNACAAIVASFLYQSFEFDDLLFTTGKADQYHWLQFSGYLDEKPIDSALVLVKEVFRSICYKYEYIFIDLS